MLVLTRKPNEKIHIGNNVTLTVLRIQGNTVRIGLEAPRDVRVIRGELKPFEKAPPDEAPVDGQGMIELDLDMQAAMAWRH